MRDGPHSSFPVHRDDPTESLRKVKIAYEEDRLCFGALLRARELGPTTLCTALATVGDLITTFAAIYSCLIDPEAVCAMSAHLPKSKR